MKEKSEWLARLVATDQLGSNDIEEIEGHLEESMAELTRLGLSEKEAFLVATARMGHPIEIAEGFESFALLPKRVKALLYMILGGVLAPLFSVLSKFLSALIVYVGARSGWLRFEDYTVWVTSLNLVIYAVILTVGVWAIMGRRSPMTSWLLKLGSRRWLFSLALLLYFSAVGLLASGTPALSQLALREVTPPEHVSHLPGSMGLFASPTQIMLWIALIIVIPWLVKMKKESPEII